MRTISQPKVSEPPKLLVTAATIECTSPQRDMTIQEGMDEHDLERYDPTPTVKILVGFQCNIPFAKCAIRNICGADRFGSPYRIMRMEPMVTEKEKQMKG